MDKQGVKKMNGLGITGISLGFIFTAYLILICLSN